MWSKASKLRLDRGIHRRLIFGLVLLFVSASPAWAVRPNAEAAALRALPELHHGTVARVPDGVTLVLDDSTGVRLGGLEPVLAASGGNPHWEDAARTLLETLTAGHGVSLRGTAAPPDRYGRMIGHLIRDDGVWIEGALLAAGVVRVEPPADGLAPFMLRREALARRRNLGLWQSPLYAVRAPADLNRDSGSFALVEADVRSVEERSGTIWLDLGGNAAARLDRPARHRFAAAGLDPLSLTGRHLRLRGWIRWQGRPVLDLNDPESVETLPSPRPRHKSR
jgi:micrococcal nuclease